MGKLLRTTDRVLIGLSIVGEVLESFGEILPSKKKWNRSIYGFFPENYKKNSYYAAVSKMLSDNLIERVVVNGQARIRISSSGKNKLVRDFPLINLQNQKWDGMWRIVTFDIPIKKRNLRDNFRRKLKELGFGMLQQSIWISPHRIEDDVKEFLDINKLTKYAYIFVANKLFLGDINNMVEKIWSIEKINDLYKKAIDSKNADLYFKAINIDPFLPKELLGKNWYGSKALDMFT